VAPEVVIQFLTTGRSSPKVENTVGFFTSALYVRVQSRDADTFADLLNHVIDDYWQSYAIPDFSYLGADVPRPELSRSPSFNWLPPELKSSAGTAAESVTSEPLPFHNPLFVHVDGDSDPGIVFQETRDEVYGNVIFPLNRFATDMMEQFADNFLMLLRAMLTKPEMCVQDIPLDLNVQDGQQPGPSAGRMLYGADC
jgi:non-ribosomal peptide synthetase component F